MNVVEACKLLKQHRDGQITLNEEQLKEIQIVLSKSKQKFLEKSGR